MIDYFSHDANSRNTLQMKCLRSEYGNEGYAWYYYIKELLREQPGYRITITPKVLKALQDEFNAGAVTQVTTFIESCRELDLISVENQVLWMKDLDERMEPLDKKRITNRQNALRRYNKPEQDPAPEPEEKDYEKFDEATMEQQLNIHMPVAEQTQDPKKERQDVKAVLNLWKSYGATFRQSDDTTPEITKAIEKAIKKHGYDKVCHGINNYAKVLKASRFFATRWKIDVFMKQSNALDTFIDDETVTNYTNDKPTKTNHPQEVIADGKKYGFR